MLCIFVRFLFQKKKRKERSAKVYTYNVIYMYFKSIEIINNMKNMINLNFISQFTT